MIQTSEQIDQIGPALVKAQLEMDNVKKTAENGAYKKLGTNKGMLYATLSDCIEAVKEPLNNNGLFLSSALIETEEGYAACQIYVLHGASGQYLTNTFKLKIEKLTAQGFGSAGTYVQRYALVSFFALEQEDDDGNKASGVKVGATHTASNSQGVQSATQVPGTSEKAITEAQRAILNEARAKLGMEAYTLPMNYGEYVTAGKALKEEIEKKSKE